LLSIHSIFLFLELVNLENCAQRRRAVPLFLDVAWSTKVNSPPFASSGRFHTTDYR
jgi:hypothetical protein